MEIKRLGTTKLTVKFNTKHTNWDDTQTDFIGIEGEARSRCYSFKIQDAEGINFISENVKMLFKERGSSKVYFSKAVWNPEEEIYYCDIPGNILQKTQIIDIQVCVEDGITRILTPVITKQVLSSLMSGAAASSGNDIYIDFENLNDIQKIVDSEEERKKNELERIEDSKRIKDMLDTNLGSELDNKINTNLMINSQEEWLKPERTRFFLFDSDIIVGDFISSDKITLSFKIKGIDIVPSINSIQLKFESVATVPNTNNLIRYITIDNIGSFEENINVSLNLDEKQAKCPKFEKTRIDIYNLDSGELEIKQLKLEKGKRATNWCPSIFEIDEIKRNGATKTELISSVNLLNAKIDEKNKDCVTKTEYAKDKKRLNSTIAREKKLETLAGLILEELRRQNPDLQPIDVASVLKVEDDEE